MSDKQILEIIRRHTGPNPEETGVWPHAEIEEMISATRDGDDITAEERSNLLYVIYAFGGNAFTPQSDLNPADKEALKKAALFGIETAQDFQALSPREQTSFVRYCVLQSTTQSVGFSQVPTSTLPAHISRLVDDAMAETLRRAGGDKFDPTTKYASVSAIARAAEVYCYILTGSYEAKDQSGDWVVMTLLNARGSFFRTMYEGFDPNEPNDNN